MRKQTTPTEKPTGELREKLRQAVEAVGGLVITDRPSYYIVRKGKTTLGYVNGKRTFRIDAPKRSGHKPMKVTKVSQIPKAVEFLLSFIPQAVEPKAAQKSATKPAPKKVVAKKQS